MTERPGQLDSLQHLLAEILAGEPSFYRSRLMAAGLGEGVGTLDEFVAKMPFTTKGELVADHESRPPYGTNHTYPLRNYSRFCQTSGTSGHPMAWLDTGESWSSLLDSWETVYWKSDVRVGQDAVYFAFSFGPFLGFWTAFEAASRMGLLCIPGGGLSSRARVTAIESTAATVLCCTPTYALRLGEVAEEMGVELSSVQKIIVAGEPGGSIRATRNRISQLWGGAQVIDHHGMTEVGPVSYEHPEEPGNLCVIGKAYLAEVIDPESGQEVADGGEGELVLTTLQRVACPLLRYRTGDLVRKRSGDGDLVLEGGILGRLDDMVVVRGVNLYPAAVEQVLRRFDEVIEYEVRQSTQHSMVEVQVAIEAAEEADADILRGSVEAALGDAFSLRIPVVLEEGLPRYEFKAKRWVAK
ncbi:MAG: phenylacetate--CoA ligase family protein [Verrucomicrobiales bacterium]